MEIFYAYEVADGFARLDAEESVHCVRVLRRRVGDEIDVIDGSGSLLHCRICDDSPKGAAAQVLSEQKNFGAHPYHLTMAVCPTKNMDRYEWFVEKATELGVDEIVPVIGDRSERKVIRLDRLQKLLLSASKQSLKGKLPVLREAISVKQFCAELGGKNAEETGSLMNGTLLSSAPLKLICYCSDEVQPRSSAMEAVREFCRKSLEGGSKNSGQGKNLPKICILVGPEGDFSPEEVKAAIAAGFVPVHLGSSRLRTETAAVTAVEAVYLNFA